MKNVTYNSDSDTITLQPGVLWEDAIAAAEPYGVAPLGGRVGSVTIGLLFVQMLTLILLLQ
jgi:FAD/FMN-containing dehydrogenase